ncbi:MAG: Rab family GTPase [Promethearchaeota archaeon]
MQGSWIFKVIIAGAGGVGKTAMVMRYCEGKFIEDHKMTIGASFHTKQEILDDGQIVKMQLWDFAGEKRFRELLPDYCKGASGAFICFDLTDYDSFRELQEWLKIIRSNAGFIPIILMGMKWDLPNHEVSWEVANDYAQKARCNQCVFCSSKLNINITESFQAMAKWLIYYATQEDQGSK